MCQMWNMHNICPNNILTFQDTPKLTSPCLRKGRGTCHEVCPRVSSGRYQIEIREKLKNEIYTTPYKFKPAVTGCPNQCVRPNIHDFGIMGLKYTKINEDKCENCGRCNEICKKEAISYDEGVAKRNTDLCVTCGNCSKACPYDAIEITGIGYRVFIGGKSGRETVEGKEID